MPASHLALSLYSQLPGTSAERENELARVMTEITELRKDKESKESAFAGVIDSLQVRNAELTSMVENLEKRLEDQRQAIERHEQQLKQIMGDRGA